MTAPDSRTYRIDEVVSFRKTGEEFGGLSNMAPGFPLRIAGISLRTSEALYQACRFPHMPEVQRLIVTEMSPMTAKMRSKPYRTESREDWDEIRVRVMKWCLRIKLAQNWSKFGEILLRTGDRAIVEDSRKDDYWGAIKDRRGELHGKNVLGRLLMELREKLKHDPGGLRQVAPLKLDNFTLLGRDIPVVLAEPVDGRDRWTPVYMTGDTLHLWASF